MKNIEIIGSILLILLISTRPSPLKNVYDTILGKIILLIVLVIIASMSKINGGLFALMLLSLNVSFVEAFDTEAEREDAEFKKKQRDELNAIKQARKAETAPPEFPNTQVEIPNTPSTVPEGAPITVSDQEPAPAPAATQVQDSTTVPSSTPAAVPPSNATDAQAQAVAQAPAPTVAQTPAVPSDSPNAPAPAPATSTVSGTTTMQESFGTMLEGLDNNAQTSVTNDMWNITNEEKQYARRFKRERCSNGKFIDSKGQPVEYSPNIYSGIPDLRFRNNNTCNICGDASCEYKVVAPSSVQSSSKYNKILQKKDGFDLYRIGSGECTNKPKTTACDSDPNCIGMAQQSNGCWHLLGKTGTDKKNITSYTKIYPKKDKTKFKYIGEGGCTSIAPTAACASNPSCVAIGQQPNGCWHLLGTN